MPESGHKALPHTATYAVWKASYAGESPKRRLGYQII